jgi:hypothetical protein
MLRNCALYLAIPLTRDTFGVALARSDGCDFAAEIRKTFGECSDDALWLRYRPLVDLAREVIDEADRAGVTVVPDASLDGWAHALTKFPVVTLLGHWRSSAIHAADIERPDVLLEALADRHSALWQTLRGFGDRLELPRRCDLGTVVKWLNAALVGRLDHEQSRDAQIVEREYRLYRRRPHLDRALAGALRGGAAVEFADGFHPIAAILARIDARIAGMVDLTVCSSILLGEEIRRKCRHCIVLGNAAPTAPAFRLAFYRQVVRLMRSGGRSYPDTVMALRGYIIDHMARSQ